MDEHYDPSPSALKLALRALAEAVVVAHQEANKAGWKRIGVRLEIVRSIVGQDFREVCEAVTERHLSAVGKKQ